MHVCRVLLQTLPYIFFTNYRNMIDHIRFELLMNNFLEQVVLYLFSFPHDVKTVISDLGFNEHSRGGSIGKHGNDNNERRNLLISSYIQTYI